MKVYKKQVFEDGAGSQSMTIRYQELSPAELAALNAGALAVLEELRAWLEQGESIATNETRSCYTGTKMVLGDLESEHLSPAAVEDLRKMQEKARAWEIFEGHYDKDDIETWAMGQTIRLNMGTALKRARAELEREKGEKAAVDRIRETQEKADKYDQQGEIVQTEEQREFADKLDREYHETQIKARAFEIFAKVRTNLGNELLDRARAELEHGESEEKDGMENW